MSKHPANAGPSRDVTCPYFAILPLWEQRERLVPEAARASTPFFVGPDGFTAVDTNVVLRVITDAASALALVGAVGVECLGHSSRKILEHVGQKRHER